MAKKSMFSGTVGSRMQLFDTIFEYNLQLFGTIFGRKMQLLRTVFELNLQLFVTVIIFRAGARVLQIEY